MPAVFKMRAIRGHVSKRPAAQATARLSEFHSEDEINSGHESSCHGRCSGSFVPGKVLTKVEASRVMVPQESITSFVGVTKVFKITSSNVAKAIDVVTGQDEVIKDAGGRDTRWVEVASGDIGPNDKVAVSGLTKLVDGSPVLIDTTRAKPETATSPSATGE